jgi:hypothetical protein
VSELGGISMTVVSLVAAGDRLVGADRNVEVARALDAGREGTALGCADGSFAALPEA